MPGEKRQFRILYRDSLLRLVDLEALSTGGDTGKLLGQFAALLAALGFTFMMAVWPKYMTGALARDEMLAAIHAETRFVFATGMAVAGLIAVMAWNTILPDRRDCAILGVLPVRLRTLFLARTAAVASVTGGALAALNLFPGFFYPFLIGPAGSGIGPALVSLIAYWVAVAAMGCVAICALLAVQGLSALLFSRHAFLRFSSWIQLGAFFAIVGSYFLMPPATSPTGASSWFPSYWFFALWTAMSGTASPSLSNFAARWIWVLAAVFAVGVPAAMAAFPHVFRRTVEQPDIISAGRRRPASRLLPLLARRLFVRPLERAIVLFSARTLLRSRQHRLLLAMWSGVGLAISLVYLKDLVYGYSGGLMDSLGVEGEASSHWNQANVPFLVGTLVLLFFAIVGVRSVFVLPMELRANWVFRVTAVHSPAAYFSAVRKALLVLGAGPVWMASLLLFTVWPPMQALKHVAILILTGVLVVEISLYRFRKIPFTCSYLPGKSKLNVRLGAYAVIIILIADRGVALEYWTFHNDFAFVALLAALFCAAAWAHRRTAEFANARGNRIQFEDAADAEIFALDLRQDGAWLSDDAFVNAIDLQPALSNWNVDESKPSKPRLIGLSLSETAALPKEPSLPVRIQLEQLWQDLRQGVRVFRKSPGFSAVTVALIALGLGVNLTIFSVIQSILSKPAPAVRAKGLVIFGHTINGEVAPGGPLNSYPDYLDLAARTKTMSTLAASGAAPWLTLTLADGTYEIRGEMVTPNYFETLGVSLVEGRSFTAEEAAGTGELPVVIGYKLWQEQFHGAAGMIGREIMLNGRRATVVGISGNGFQGDGLLPRFEIGLPLPGFADVRGEADRLQDRQWRSLTIFGRLARGATLSAARKEFKGLSERLRSLYPDDDAGWAVALQPYSATAFGPNSSPQARRMMTGVTLIAILALLVVCANVASLMLSRSVKRAREMAVRLSLGASRFRLARMLLAEGFSLAMTACLAAWFLTVWVTRALGKAAPPLASGARFQVDLSPDGATLLYGMALAAVAAALFTVAPVSGLWNERILPLLRAAEQSIIQKRSRLVTGMVVMQIALCAALVTTGSLAYRSLFQIDHTDIYFTKSNLLLAEANTAGAAGSSQENLLLLERLRARLQKVEGVTNISYATAAPPHDHGWMELPVQAMEPGRSAVSDGTVVGPDYIAALGVPELRGRDISAEDIIEGRATAVINRKLAEALWPGEGAVGKRILPGEGGQPIEVVGVVPNGAFSGVGKDGSFVGIGAAGRPNFIFLSQPREALAPGTKTFHIRYRGDLEALVPRIRAAVREIDGRIPVFSVRTMEQEFNSFTAPIRIITLLIAAFAISALVLSSVGLYAAVVFHTRQRTREFGIRAALGGTPRQLMRMVMEQSLTFAFCGIAIGLVLAAAIGKAGSALLLGVNPMDAATYAAVTAALVCVMLAACYGPARRASRIDPMQALREE